MADKKHVSFEEAQLPDNTLRLFVTTNVISVLDASDFDVDRYKNVVIDFTDSCLKYTIIRKGNNLHITQYARIKEWEEGVSNDEYVVNIHDGITNENLLVPIGMLRVVCNHIAENYTDDQLAVCCDEFAGLMFKCQDGKIESRIVAGRERPALVYLDDGKDRKCRPYRDERMMNFFNFLGGNDVSCMDLDELIEAAEEDDEQALDRLYLAYLNGDDELEVEADVNEAVKWLKKYAETENSVALFNLALHYVKGYGVERDYQKAYEMMKAADENGDEDAAGWMEKLRVLPSKINAAKNGDAQAAADYARFLMENARSLEQAGPGKDYEECLIWAKKAAAKNNGDALWILGLAFEHGRGVKADLTQAAKYYRQGAELGNASCQNSLGVMYMNGNPMPRDMKQGFEWTRKSALQGDGLAMYNLGRCYQFGHGVEEDMTKAIEWYEKSLEVRPDEELERKVAIFKDLESRTKDVSTGKAQLPPGYMKALDKIANDFKMDGDIFVKYNGTDTKVNVPYNLKEIGSRAFVLNNHITEVNITPKIDTIGEKAFMGCHNLKKVTLPNTLRVIHDFGFANCENIAEIDFPESLEKIGECAFINCSGLKTLTIPKGVKVISSGAFTNCSGLEKVVLPEGLKTIENEAFADCVDLKEINCPSSLSKIAPDAFRNCGKLANSPILKKAQQIAAKHEEEEKERQAQKEAQRRKDMERKAHDELTYLCEQQRFLAEKKLSIDIQEKNKAVVEKAFDDAIRAQETERLNLTRELEAQGFFAFGRKKELKQQIADVGTKINALRTVRGPATDYKTNAALASALTSLCNKPNQPMAISEMCEASDSKISMRLAQKLNEWKDNGFAVRTEQHRKAMFHLVAYPAPFTLISAPLAKEIEAECLRRAAEQENIQVEGELTFDSVAEVIFQKMMAGKWKRSAVPVSHENSHNTCKNLIMKVLGFKGMLQSEIQAADPELAEMSAQKIAACLRELVVAGQVKRYEENRKAYFHL